MASMSTPLRKVLVPKPGCTWGPNALTMRPSVGQGRRRRKAPNPVRGAAPGGVVAAQDQGQGRALSVDLVHDPEALGQGPLLAGPLALEAVDVAPKGADLGLHAPDLPIQSGH